jgi:tape measure domain-containing protein
MANNTVKFDIKAAIDTRGLDEFQSQLGELRSTAEPLDRVLGEAVKSIKEWSEASRLSERNTTAATSAINALRSAMTAGGTEWRKAAQAGDDLNRTLRETVNAANAAKAALAAPARTTGLATQQIADMRKGLQDLTIGSSQYLTLLQQITEREALLGRRTGRAGVIASNQAFEGALLTRGYGAADRLQDMPNTTAALNQRYQELAQTLPNVARGTEAYFRVAREMSQIEKELARDLTGTTQALRQRSAATQAKIDAVRAYNRDAIADRVAAGLDSPLTRRQTDFGGVPQAFQQPGGTFIAPPYRTDSRSFPSRFDPGGMANANGGAVQGPITPLDYWAPRISQGPMQAPQAPTDLFRSIGGIDTAGASARLQTMGRSYEQVAVQIRRTAQAAGGSTRALQAERQAWEQLQASVRPASRRYREAGEEISRLDRQLGALGRGARFAESAGAISAGAFFGGPEGLLGGLIGTAIAGPAGALGGASIGAQVGIVRKSVGEMATFSSELTKLRIALQGVTGDGADFAKALEAVNGASMDLNISQDVALRGFTRLSASVLAAGGSIEDAKLVFDGVNVAIKGTGGSSEEAQAALLALSQVFSKGKVSAEELSGQLGERLAGAVAVFARATGRTLEQLNEDLKKGEVGLADVMKFTQELSQKYANSAEDIAKSSEDAGARATVAWNNYRDALGSVFQPLGSQLQDSAAQFFNWAASVIRSIQGVNDEIAKIRVPRPQFDNRNAEQEASRILQSALQNDPGSRAGGTFGSVVRINYGGKTYVGSPTEVRKALEKDLLAAIDLQQSPAAPSPRKPSNFPDLAGGKGAEASARAAEKEERKRQEEAARAQRLALQIYNDQVRLQEQLAENRIRQEDRIFQYKQELLRREREQLQQLDQIRQQTFISGLSPEGRSAVAPFQDLIQRLQGLGQERQGLVDAVEAAKQAVKSAEQMAANAQRFGAMYREDGGGVAIPAAGGIRGGAITGRNRDPDAEATGWDIVMPGGRGAPVQAPLELTITGTGFQGRGAGSSGRGYGNWVSGEFTLGGKRYELLLGHFDRVDVAPGVRVPAGGVIGTQGITGRTFGTHVTTHVNPKGGASVADAWRALDAVTRIWERGGVAGTTAPTTTTLANGRDIRTPGAQAAAMRAAGSARDVEAARDAQAQAQAQLSAYDKLVGSQKLELFNLSLAQNTQNLRDQQQALRDNLQELQIRNRLELEGLDPERIEFEVRKTRILNQQGRELEGITKFLKENEVQVKALFQTEEEYRQAVNQLYSDREQATARLINLENELFAVQNDSGLALERRISQLGQSMRDFSDTQKLAIGLSEQFSSNLAGGFSNAVSSIVSGNGTLQQSFADLFSNVAKMFIDTISRVLADKLTQYFLTLLRGPASPFTTAAPDIFSSFTGGVTGGFGGFGGGSVAGLFSSSLPILQFATGGISSGPTSGYPVTLHGTEAVIPLPNGRSVPVEMKGSGGTNVVVNVNMATGETDVNAGERDGELLGKALSDAVQAELIRQKRPGGILYR